MNQHTKAYQERVTKGCGCVFCDLNLKPEKTPHGFVHRDLTSQEMRWLAAGAQKYECRKDGVTVLILRADSEAEAREKVSYVATGWTLNQLWK